MSGDIAVVLEVVCKVVSASAAVAPLLDWASVVEFRRKRKI